MHSKADKINYKMNDDGSKGIELKKYQNKKYFISVSIAHEMGKKTQKCEKHLNQLKS